MLAATGLAFGATATFTIWPWVRFTVLVVVHDVADPLIWHVGPLVPFPVIPPPVLPIHTVNVQLCREPGAVGTVIVRVCSVPAQLTVCWPFVFTWFIATAGAI